MAEMLGAHVEDGQQGYLDDADPWGFNLIPSYKVNDEWELVFRYSYFDGDKRGIRPSDGIRRANNPGEIAAYDKAQALYFGFNYYLQGNDLKLSAGYEYADFSDQVSSTGSSVHDDDAKVNGLRARLQLLF